MGNLLESLKNYFENTPQDILEKDWKEVEHLNEIGPDVVEYAEYVNKYFGIEVSYLSIDKPLEMHRFDISKCSGDNSIAADAQYCLAA